MRISDWSSDVCSSDLHGFVYALEFHGGEGPRPEGVPWWSPFLRFTAPGYVLSLLISLYVLWTFGRVDDLGATPIVMVTVVLGFPAAVGAASARLALCTAWEVTDADRTSGEGGRRG